MLKISGVNFWPSQVEQILLKNEETSSEYNIRIYSSNSMDAMEILVESRDNISEEKKKSLASDLQYELRESLLFSPIIKVVEPNSLPRVEAGKARRVFDERASRA
jgi:phenylacetate-CoA ligase